MCHPTHGAQVGPLASAKHARESGLKPKQALRNLSPAELYEKVRGASVLLLQGTITIAH
jgi:hypothetical protein